MILGYTTFVRDEHRIVERGTEIRPANEALFFSQRGFCPFCKVKVPVVLQGSYGKASLGYTSGYITVWACAGCGWWEQEEAGAHEMPEQGIYTTTLLHAVLAVYDPSDTALPVSVLLTALQKDRELLREIHPWKLEQLVASVFADFFACEVEHVGRSNDGGVDLVLVNGDSPTLVQVKRRRNRRSESVATVREFLGAMVLSGATSGIFLTTATDFSRQAQNAAMRAVSLNAVTRYELVNLRRLLEMLSLVRTREDNEP